MIKNRLSNETIILYYLYCGVITITLSNILSIVFPGAMFIASVIGYLRYLLIIPVLYKALHDKVSSFPIVLFALYIVLVLISFACIPDLSKAGISVRHVVDFVTEVIIPIILIDKLSGFEKLSEKFRFFIVMAVLCSLSQWAVWFTVSEKQYSMPFSYAVMPMMLYLLVTAWRKKKLIPLIVFAFIFVTCVVCGSRSSLLCCIVLVAVLLFTEKNTPKTFILKIVCIAALSCAYLFSGQIFAYLASVFPDSRTFSSFADHGFSYSAGRDIIWKEHMDVVLEHPFAFRGLYADRYISYTSDAIRARYPQTTDFSSLYSHNIAVELFVQFGMIIGMLILLYFIYSIIRSGKIAKHSGSQDASVWYIVTLTCALSGLLVSGSYLTDIKFGIICGVICKICSSRKRTAEIPQNFGDI